MYEDIIIQSLSEELCRIARDSFMALATSGMCALSIIFSESKIQCMLCIIFKTITENIIYLMGISDRFIGCISCSEDKLCTS